MFPQSSDLPPPVTIQDAVSDLPLPGMDMDDQDYQLHYVSPPKNEFQEFVRCRRCNTDESDSEASETMVTEHCSRLARDSEVCQRKPLRSFNIPAPTVTGKPAVTLLLDTRISTTPRLPTVREVARFQCLFFPSQLLFCSTFHLQHMRMYTQRSLMNGRLLAKSNHVISKSEFVPSCSLFIISMLMFTFHNHHHCNSIECCSSVAGKSIGSGIGPCVETNDLFSKKGEKGEKTLALKCD